MSEKHLVNTENICDNTFSKIIEFNYDENIFMLKSVMFNQVNRGVPFVIRKYIPETLCLKWQNLNYLSKKINNVLLPIERYDNIFYDVNNMTTINLTLREYIEYLKSPKLQKEKLYLAEVELFNSNKKSSILQVLDADIPYYNQFYINKLVSRILFLGKDTVTQMHYHNTVEAILNQISGLKHIFLFPPNNSLFYQMKPFPWYSSKNNFSQMTFNASNPEQFKKIATQSDLKGGIEVLLEPGDCLYIPVYWWHIVFGTNISLSFTDLFNASIHKKYLSFLGLRSRNHMALLKKIWY